MMVATLALQLVMGGTGSAHAPPAAVAVLADLRRHSPFRPPQFVWRSIVMARWPIAQKTGLVRLLTVSE